MGASATTTLSFSSSVLVASATACKWGGCGPEALCIRGRCQRVVISSTAATRNSTRLNSTCFDKAWPHVDSCVVWWTEGDLRLMESNAIPPFALAPYCPFGLGQGYCESPAFGGSSTDCDPFFNLTCPCTPGNAGCPAETPTYGDIPVATYQRFEFPLRPDPTERGRAKHMYDNSCLKSGNTYQVIGAHLSGVQLKGPAEANGFNVDTSLIPLFCGGHVTPPVGPGPVYHFHKAADCLDIKTPGRHGPLVGYAADGFAIYGFGDEGGTEVLDECHGHFGPDPTGRVTYHYHVSAVHNRGGSMAFQPYYLGCLGPSLGTCNATVSSDYDGGANWCGPGCGADVCVQPGTNKTDLLAYLESFPNGKDWLERYTVNDF